MYSEKYKKKKLNKCHCPLSSVQAQDPWYEGNAERIGKKHILSETQGSDQSQTAC